MKNIILVLVTSLSLITIGNRLLFAQIEIIPLPDIGQADQIVEDKSSSPDERPQVGDEKMNLTVSEIFAQQKGYRTDEPLTWEFIEPIVELLRERGVRLPANSELQPLFLSQGDRFYKMLATRKGRLFFKDLSRNPAAIDRAERYLSLPNGPKELQFIITRKGGAEFFTDMVSNPNGRATARMISANTGVQKYDQPTGKIYLEAQFLDYLKSVSTTTDSADKPSGIPRPRKYD